MKCALLIGVVYGGKSYQLKGCHNDIDHCRSYLREQGYRDIAVLKDDGSSKNQPTKEGILRELNRLVKRAQTDGARELVIQFSGHGVKHGVRAIKGTRTGGGFDTALLPSDGEKNGLLTQSTISAYLRLLPESCRVLLIFDCCHSGTITNLPYQLIHSHRFDRLNNVPFKATMLCISSCTREGKSIDVMHDGGWMGALTREMLRLLRRGEESGDLRIVSLLGDLRKAMMKHGYSQVPQISSTWKFGKRDSLAFGKKSLFFRKGGKGGKDETGKPRLPPKPKTVKELRRWRMEKRQLEREKK